MSRACKEELLVAPSKLSRGNCPASYSVMTYTLRYKRLIHRFVVDPASIHTIFRVLLYSNSRTLTSPPSINWFLLGV
jgi:hypothetical protein